MELVRTMCHRKGGGEVQNFGALPETEGQALTDPPARSELPMPSLLRGHTQARNTSDVLLVLQQIRHHHQPQKSPWNHTKFLSDCSEKAFVRNLVLEMVKR